MRSVEGNEFGERGKARAVFAKIAVQSVFELVQQNLVARGTHVASAPDLDGVDQLTAQRHQSLRRRVKRGVRRRVAARAEVIAHHTEAHALQIRLCQSVSKRCRCIERSGIVFIAPGHDLEQHGSAMHGSRHGPGGILARGDRNDAVPADESHRGLDTDDAVDAGRANHRAVGFGTDGQRRQSRGHGHRRPAR